MSQNTIQERVIDVIERWADQYREGRRPTLDMHLRDDLGADSLERVEIVMAIEEEFSIEIPDDEAERILTVQQAVDCVTEALEG